MVCGVPLGRLDPVDLSVVGTVRELDRCLRSLSLSEIRTLEECLAALCGLPVGFIAYPSFPQAHVELTECLFRGLAFSDLMKGKQMPLACSAALVRVSPPVGAASAVATLANVRLRFWAGNTDNASGRSWTKTLIKCLVKKNLVSLTWGDFPTLLFSLHCSPNTS